MSQISVATGHSCPPLSLYPVDVPVEVLDTVWWQDYRNQRGLTRPLEEALKHLGLLKPVDGAWKPTRLAVLLFAEFPSDLLGEKCASQAEPPLPETGTPSRG